MTNASAKAKAAPKTAAKKQTSAFSAFEMPTIEVPTAFRDMAENGVVQAQEAYDSYNSLATEASETLEDSFATINKNASDIQSKALDAAKSQFNTGFAFFEKMLGVKTVAEAVEVQSEFARKQFDTLAAQTKELQDLATKVQAETAKPFKDGVEKAMTQWNTATPWKVAS